MSSRKPLRSTTHTQMNSAPDRRAGNRQRAETGRSAAGDASAVQRPPLPGIDEWEAALGSLTLTPYLQRIDAGLRRWYQAADREDAAGRQEQVAAIQTLSAAAGRLFDLPPSEYDAIPERVRWLIMDVTTAAKAIRDTGQCGTEFRRPKEALARTQHLAARAQLRSWIAAALQQSGDRRLTNAAQWVQQGLLRIVLVTPTGDAAERTRAAGMNPETDVAYFPDPCSDAAWTIFDDVPDPVYNPVDLAANDNVHLRRNSRATAGWNGGDVIVVTAAGLELGRDHLWETLRHDVQHAADHHGAAPIERYKTEYRAYAYEGSDGFAGLDNTTTNIVVDDPDDDAIQYRFTARQHAIFKIIHDAHSHTSDGWRDNPEVGGISFRHAVAAYRDPDSEAVNKWNSPRIELFFRRLATLPADTATVTPALKGLLKASFVKRETRLGAADARYLLDAPAARRHWEKQFSGKALSLVTTNLQRTAGGWRPWRLAAAIFLGF